VTVVLKKIGQKLKLEFPEIMVNYLLSKRAEKDLGNFAVYSIQNFGIQQARIY
jgi:hypothetical protein